MRLSTPVFATNPGRGGQRDSLLLGVPLIDEDGYVLSSLGVLDDEPRAFMPAEQAVLGFHVRLVRSVLSLRRHVAWHRWDAGLLAAQGQALEAVAAGLPLEWVLDMLTALVTELGTDANADLDAAAGDGGPADRGGDQGRRLAGRRCCDQLVGTR